MENEKLPQWVQDTINEEKIFWQEKYPCLSFEEKAKHWSGTLFRQMRWQGESGLDEYAFYTPEWYESIKKTEPDFDKIMDEVFDKYWKGVWDKSEYLKRTGIVKT